MIWRKKRKILVVDDDPDTVELIAANLSEKYKCIKAFNGKEAIDRAGKEKPDLIILDAMMPGIDGWQVLHILKRRALTRDIPVLMCTARQTVGDVEKSFSLGTDAYIIKPIDLDILNQKVGDLLKGKF